MLTDVDEDSDEDQLESSNEDRSKTSDEDQSKSSDEEQTMLSDDEAFEEGPWKKLESYFFQKNKSIHYFQTECRKIKGMVKAESLSTKAND